MKFTDLFVRRPVLALVVSLLILLIGLRAGTSLPVRQFPQLESATITVTTTYPGAAPDLMQGFVTAPVAQSIATADGVEYLSSTTTQGRSVIQARLRLNADSDRAMTEVIAKINEVKYRLPREVNDPVVTKSTGEPTAVMYLSFVTDDVPIHAVTDAVVRVAQPAVSSVPGVAATELRGGQGLAMRVWLDPTRLAARGLSAGDVADALRRNNVQAAPGQIKGAFTVATVAADTDLTDAEAFKRMVVKADAAGRLVHLDDIATVELGEQNTDQSGLFNGKKGTSLAILATPTGNPLDIVREVKAMLPAVQRDLPPGVEVFVSYDVARFIHAATDEVRTTLLEAVVIVVVVIFLFLGSLRTVLIPVVTIPLSLIGSAALMLAFGFSLNLLTLLAMVLAIGLVVDDAIVVVENVYRHIEEGMTGVQAALVGAREIVGPVVAMTITLAAVYAPIGFMGGLTGSLFREFAFTLAGSVVVSGVVALTLSPMMASYLLTKETTQGRFPRLIDAAFSRLTAVYARLLRVTLANRLAVGVFAAGAVAGIGFLYGGLKRELAPTEDQATVFTVVKGPQYANLDYTEVYTRKLEAQLRALPEYQTTFFTNGSDGPNNAFGGINLTDWDKRDRSALTLQYLIQADAATVEGEGIFVFQLPSLPGSTGGLPVQMVVRTTAGYEAVFAVMERLKEKARKSGLFVVVDSDLRYDNPVVRVRVNRLKANELGVDMKEVADTLAVLVGENYVNRFNLKGRSYDVIPQVPRSDRLTPDSLGKYYVKTRSGFLTPLSTVVEISTATEPNRLTQFNQLNAATLQAIPAPGVTMGEAVAFLDREAKGTLPPGYSSDWLGDSRQYVREGDQLTLTFAFALVVIFLVLAAQFESLRDPLVILVTVPLSVVGALVPLYLGYATLNIYTQIGLVTLIGLISKHGILMVEFANEVQRHDGLGRRAAIERAAAVRLRPILMTTAAMVVGLVPLLLGHGAGAASRFSIGVVVVVGMLVGTAFTLFVLPTVYSVLAKDHHAAAHSKRAKELAGADAPADHRPEERNGHAELIDPSAGQGVPAPRAGVGRPGRAHVPQVLAAARVVDRHPLPAPAARDQPGQQRRPGPDGPLVGGAGAVVRQPPLVRVVPLPGDVRRAHVRDERQVLGRRDDRPPRPRPAGRLPPRVGPPPPVAVVPGVHRVPENVGDRVPGRRPPLQLAAVRAGVRADAEPDVVGRQVAEHLADRPQPVELVEHHADDAAGLLVRVEVEPAAGRADVADRRGEEHLAAADLVEQPLPHPAAEDVDLRLRHDPPKAQQHPVVGVGRVVHPVGVGEQGAEQAAQLDELVPVLARPGEPAHLQPEHGPDVVQADLGQEPLEPGPALGRGPALALVVVDHQNPVGRPAEVDRPAGQGVLAVGRLPVDGHLVGGGLADVHDGQPVQVPRLDLGRASDGGATGHRSPPAAGAVGGAGRAAGRRGGRAAAAAPG